MGLRFGARDGWMDGLIIVGELRRRNRRAQMDGWMDGRKEVFSLFLLVDEWMDGWMDGHQAKDIKYTA